MIDREKSILNAVALAFAFFFALAALARGGERPKLPPYELGVAVTPISPCAGEEGTVRGHFKNRTDRTRWVTIWYRINGPRGFKTDGHFLRLVDARKSHTDRFVGNAPNIPGTYKVVVWASIDNKTVDTVRFDVVVVPG